MVSLDLRDDGVNRIIKAAKVADESCGGKRVEILHEAYIVWINEGHFTLVGFERVLREWKVAEYAKFWLCRAEPVGATT